MSQEPLRKVIKEWGETVDVCTKLFVRCGFFAVGLFKGQLVVDLLKELL